MVYRYRYYLVLFSEIAVAQLYGYKNGFIYDIIVLTHTDDKEDDNKNIGIYVGIAAGSIVITAFVLLFTAVIIVAMQHRNTMRGKNSVAHGIDGTVVRGTQMQVGLCMPLCMPYAYHCLQP